MTVTFTKDGYPPEILAYRAWQGKGLPDELVRKMLIGPLEKRFGNVEGIPEAQASKFHSNNDRAYITAESRQIARAVGLEAGQNAGVQPTEQQHGRGAS